MSADPRDREARRLAELGLLTAGLLHELRQPVFALKALGQLAQQSPEKAPGYVDQMLEQVRTLEELIAGYGDFSRRPSVKAEVFDLRTPIRSALVVLEHRANACGVPLDVDLGDGVAVRGALLAVQQAVVNLGQNALDALRGGEAPKLTIRAGRRDGVAWIRIEDNGPGLPPEIRANLFEPFQTTKPAGTGLGLSISRDLVAACGGTLRLLDGVGTTWEITLPAADV